MDKQWFRLDTAALIFPAIMKRDWVNVFRVSVTLTEPVDPEILKEAVNALKGRFPTYYVRLKKGVFWCYLEECSRMPYVRQDFAYPLTHMGNRELSSCALRIFYYENRIAAEFFHVLSDGNGGNLYIQTLLEKYLELKHRVHLAPEERAMDWEAEPSEEELEDSFLKNNPGYGSSRNDSLSYRLHGTKEPRGFRRLICGSVDTDQLHAMARSYHCSITVFLAAVMADSIIKLQALERPVKHHKPVKITIPIDLRRLYGSKTLRNFVLTLNLGVDPRLGTYSMQDLCDSIGHQLKSKATPQYMGGMIGANVLPQQILAIKLAPLPIKNLVMGLVYNATGESQGCINISNIGGVTLPDKVLPYVQYMDFIIGPQKTYPNNCSVISCNGITRINMIGMIKERTLEQLFFSKLVELGLPVYIESNDR
ncbi:MAG: hypothetical protein HUJ69_02115 [Lachnospiraceae bacterium]|nr:hypothetical protein [Lachnospiraceae bacterium]